MGRWTSFGIVVGLAGAAVVASGQTGDRDALLASARTAIGGDAALDRITSFTTSGSLTREVGPVSTSEAVEYYCLWPDKFLRKSRRTVSQGPLGSFDIETSDGFNGANPIHSTYAPDARVPVEIPASPAPTAPDAIAAARVRALSGQQHRFAQLMIPLFVASVPAYALSFASAPAQADTTADAVQVTGSDGFFWRLYFDRQTHRPTRLSWMAKPIVTVSSSSTAVVSSRGQEVRSSPMVLPSGDPTSNLADVEWTMAIGDYRTADGLTWPHRFTTSFGGKKWEDLRLGKFQINAKINPKLFDDR